MPKQPQLSSTIRRQRLCDFIESFGEVMVQKCATCVKYNRVCKVHVRSGKCSECLRRGQRCNVRVTESEFKRLVDQKSRLRDQIKESREAQEVAMKAHEKALEALRVARAREERLRQQMDLVDRRAEEAIAVEARDIEEQEAAEALLPEDASDALGLNLSPSTWGAFEGFSLEFWEDPLLVGSSGPASSGQGTAAAVAGSS